MTVTYYIHFAAVRRHAGCTSVLIANLKEDLDKLKSLSINDDDEHTLPLIKRAVDTFLKRSFETRIPINEVKRDLSLLSTTHLLLTESELTWSISHAEELATSMSPSCAEAVDSSKVLPARDLKPLFNKEVVYHAGLCCVVVNSPSGKNLLASDHNRHLLEEVSIARPKEGQVDRYLIARQGKTYYVAFKGELNLDNWRKHFKSFEEGKAHSNIHLTIWCTQC